MRAAGDRYSLAEIAAPRDRGPERSGEALMITGWSLVGAGLSVSSVALTTAFAGTFGWEGDAFAVTLGLYPMAAVGGCAALTGTALLAGGYGRWNRAYNQWSGPRYRSDPRGRPAQSNPLQLIVPGAVMMGVGAASSGLVYALFGEEVALAPGAVAVTTGVALLGVGLARVARRSRRRASWRARVTPSVGRTRSGTWTGGVVLRW